jgi:hypothetical protein
VDTHLPVLGVALQHERVLGLADLARVVVLDLLDVLLGLDALVLGEGALVALAAGVGEESRADGLDFELGGGREAADGLELLVGGPLAGQDGQRELVLDDDHGVGGRSTQNIFCSKFCQVLSIFVNFLRWMILAPPRLASPRTQPYYR